jgi:hypothetical protein
MFWNAPAFSLASQKPIQATRIIIKKKIPLNLC